MKILIAEDDPFTREGLCEIATGEGYEVIAACDGREAVDLFCKEEPDFVCLDIMMPQEDGFSVCKTIRKISPRVPVIFISAKSEEIDKVVGLELGADDFITKPFGAREVIARIRAVARRMLASTQSSGESGTHEHFSLGPIKVYPSRLLAKNAEEEIDLSLREIKILELFFLNPARVLSRDEIFRKVWGSDHIPNSRTLDQHISQLRKKIEANPKEPQLIQTVHGVGYRYDEST